MISNRCRKAKTAARARAALAWGLALFACGQIGFRLLLQTVPEIGEAEFGRKLTNLRAAMAENPGRPLILMLGSSRVATGFRPDALRGLPQSSSPPPLAFNFALVGTGPEMSHLVLHRLLAAGVRPTWVFVEYWPPFWASRRLSTDLLSQVDIGRLDPRGVRLLGGYIENPRRLYQAWLSWQLVPAYADRSALLHRFALPGFARPTAPIVQLENLDQSGWWCPRTSPNPDSDRALLSRFRTLYTPILARFRTQEAPDRALRATLDLCRREAIQAAVVVLPEGPEFRSWYPPDTLAEVDAYLDRLRRECAIPVIDARTWVDEPGFMDSYHLFPDGATQFTAHLGRSVLQPWLEAQARSSHLRR